MYHVHKGSAKGLPDGAWLLAIGHRFCGIYLMAPRELAVYMPFHAVHRLVYIPCEEM